MTYTVSSERRALLETLLPTLRGAERVILTTHLNADGDGTGCQAALMEFFRENGAQAWIVNPTPFPDSFRFLLGDSDRILDAGSPEALERTAAADLCVVVDTGEVNRIGRVKPMVDHIPKVILDHHPAGDRPIEGLAFRDVTAAATGEIIFDLLEVAGGPWTRPALEGIYTAILTDTGGFRFSNSTPTAHRVIAELVERGVEPDLLHRKVYGSSPLRRVRLLERSLPSFEVSEGGEVAWMTVSRDAFRELGCLPEDIEGLVDLPREVQGVEVALLFRELEEGGIKISFRSNGEADVNAIARQFEGGGHIRASGALVRGSLEEVRPRVVAAILEALTGAPELVSAIDSHGSGPDAGA